MTEVLGLNKHAWETFLAYRKKIKKPLKEVSFDAGQKKLASFGDEQTQMEAVLNTIANGWQGLFPPPAKPPAVKKKEQQAQSRLAAEQEAFVELERRAARVGFRLASGSDDLVGYRTLVERAEHAYAMRRPRGPVSITSMLEASK